MIQYLFVKQLNKMKFIFLVIKMPNNVNKVKGWLRADW